MAGSSMTFEYDEGTDGGGYRHGIRRVIATWLSDDATGAVSGTTRKLSGTLIKANTNPGSAAPTDDYDITLTDEDGVNILTACDDDLSDRDTANSEEVYFLVKDHAVSPLAQSLHPVVCGAITIAVANAGNAKAGVLTLYVKD